MKPKTLGVFLIASSIILIFVLGLMKGNLDNQSAALCEFYHEKNLDMQQCPAHKNNTSWLVTLSFGVSFLILGAGLYMLFSSHSEPKPVPVQHVDLEKLDSDEKAVYEAVRQGGSAYQSDLIKITGHSKVKITRVLDRLESKGVIERKRRGMTNIVVLK